MEENNMNYNNPSNGNEETPHYTWNTVSNDPNPSGNNEYQWKFEDYDQFSQNQPPRPPKGNTGLKIFSIVISVVFVLTVAAFAGFLLYENNGSAVNSTAEESEINMSGPDIALNNRPAPEDTNYTDGVLSTEEIAAKVRPSVVGIVTYNIGTSLTATGAGSGIIMSSDGYILTNAHVVSGASGIVVVLDNEEEYEATLIGIDEKTDIAVVKIEASGLTAAEFGNSDELVVGERIVAIGNPTGLNLAGSTTQGIVSGLQRNISVQTDDGSTISMEAIQVDAAINPGNSGGALINKYGQVVGINSSKLSSTQIEGIGFAIPMNTAKPIVDDLVTYGYVKGRVRLGITYYGISEVTGAMTGYTPGLLVNSIDETTDAYSKGLRVGDTITQIDGKDVRDAEDIQAVMEGKKPGDTVQLSIYRVSVTGKQSTFTVDVVLEEDKGTASTTTQQEQAEPTPERGNGLFR